MSGTDSTEILVQRKRLPLAIVTVVPNASAALQFYRPSTPDAMVAELHRAVTQLGTCRVVVSETLRSLDAMAVSPSAYCGAFEKMQYGF